MKGLRTIGDDDPGSSRLRPSSLLRRVTSVAGRRAGAEPLIDARAAGRLLGVPHTWVLAQARAGQIPHHRLGHYVRFRRNDLEEWLRETRMDPVRRPPPPGHVPPVQ
jgi:excisionase family DNA binding protein